MKYFIIFIVLCFQVNTIVFAVESTSDDQKDCLKNQGYNFCTSVQLQIANKISSDTIYLKGKIFQGFTSKSTSLGLDNYSDTKSIDISVPKNSNSKPLYYSDIVAMSMSSEDGTLEPSRGYIGVYIKKPNLTKICTIKIVDTVNQDNGIWISVGIYNNFYQKDHHCTFSGNDQNIHEMINTLYNAFGGYDGSNGSYITHYFNNWNPSWGVIEVY